MSAPLRVCIAAENASRRMGGEAILPWHYFRLLLARGIDVHLVTHVRCRAELLELFPEHASRLHFVRDSLLQKLFFRLGKLLPGRLADSTFWLATQMLTQSRQRKVLRSLASPGCVVHQPTPVAPRFPSLLCGLEVPVVIGPLNGGMEFPPSFRSLGSKTSGALVNLGRKLTDIGNKLFPGKAEAAVVLVANQRTRASLPTNLRGRIVEVPENGVDLSQWPATPFQAQVGQRTRFLFMGRLVDWKALDIVLEAMVTVPEAELDVVGDGPMRQQWQAITDQLKLSDRVRFHGWQPQSVCAELLTASAALVLPSLYESGGAVVLEAMAAARSVIATAWGGPAEYLDAECGILIEPTSRTALITGFAYAMQWLAASPDLCKQMGQAGRTKVIAHYDWERKADHILALYESVVT